MSNMANRTRMATAPRNRLSKKYLIRMLAL